MRSGGIEIIMGIFKYNSSSIVYRLTRMILGIMLQTLLFATILIQGGVLKQAESNAYQLFHEKAASRKDYIQREMKNNWTNFDPYVTNIAKILNGKPRSFDTNSFFNSEVEELLPMLRTTQATGAYIILNDISDHSNGLPAIYLRDYDPIMNTYSNDDIYMVYGPSQLAKALKIPLDQVWRYNFEVTETNSAFIKKSYDKASMTSKATLLGYWSKPVVKLAQQVNDSYQLKTFKLEPTGFFELDELRRAIEHANKRTLESASRLAKIVELFGLPIGAYEISHDINTVFVTHNFYEILGWNMEGVQIVPDAKAFEERLKATLSSPEADEADVYRIEGKGSRWIRFKQTDQEDAAIGVVMDITDEILEKKQIKRERDHDPLTMLLNRKGFQWYYEAWAKSNSYGSKAALIMFDLDNLKSINDTYGHKWGDQYIITAVDHLNQIAPVSNVLLGRRSGDEFVVLLHGFESREEIRNCLEHFYKKLQEEQILFPDGKLIPVMISAGVMWIESEAFSYDEMLHFADEALYEAKRNRKGFYIENNKV